MEFPTNGFSLITLCFFLLRFIEKISKYARIDQDFDRTYNNFVEKHKREENYQLSSFNQIFYKKGFFLILNNILKVVLFYFIVIKYSSCSITKKNFFFKLK